MTTTPGRTATARSDAPLAAAWLVTALAVGLVGWLLLALSESSPARTVGGGLAVGAVLAAALGAALLARVAGVRRWSVLLSGALVGLGALAVAVLMSDPPVFASDLLLVGAPPVVGGAVTGVLARRRQG